MSVLYDLTWMALRSFCSWKANIFNEDSFLCNTCLEFSYKAIDWQIHWLHQDNRVSSLRGRTSNPPLHGKPLQVLTIPVPHDPLIDCKHGFIRTRTSLLSTRFVPAWLCSEWAWRPIALGHLRVWVRCDPQYRLPHQWWFEAVGPYDRVMVRLVWVHKSLLSLRLWILVASRHVKLHRASREMNVTDC